MLLPTVQQTAYYNIIQRCSLYALLKTWDMPQDITSLLQNVHTPYYVLLNSDVEVTPGWLELPVHMMQSNPDIAACQPKIMAYHQRDSFEYAGASAGWIDAYGYPFCRGRVFDTLEKDLGQYDNPAEIFWASGARLMVHADRFHEANGFDPDFFAHMEEIYLGAGA